MAMRTAADGKGIQGLRNQRDQLVLAGERPGVHSGAAVFPRPGALAWITVRRQVVSVRSGLVRPPARGTVYGKAWPTYFLWP